MGLAVYYPKDIRNALLAAEQANASALQAVACQEDLQAKAYRQGYLAALTTIALAFGLIQINDHNGEGCKQRFASLSCNSEDADPNLLARPPPHS